MAPQAAALAGALAQGGALASPVHGAGKPGLGKTGEAAGRELLWQAVGRAEDKRRERRRLIRLPRPRWESSSGPRPSEQAAKDLVGDLSDLLDAEILTEGFGDEPLAVHVARACSTSWA